MPAYDRSDKSTVLSQRMQELYPDLGTETVRLLDGGVFNELLVTDEGASLASQQHSGAFYRGHLTGSRSAITVSTRAPTVARLLIAHDKPRHRRPIAYGAPAR